MVAGESLIAVKWFLRHQPEVYKKGIKMCKTKIYVWFTCTSQKERPGQLCVAPAIIRLGLDAPRWTMQPQRQPGPIS